MTTGTSAPEQLEAPQTPAKNGPGMLGRVGGLTVRARLIVLGATLSLLLAVVAVVAFTGFASIKSAYTADQVPTANKDYAAWAYEGWQTADDQMNMYAAVQALHNPANNSLANATWQQLLGGRVQRNKYMALLAKNHLAPQSAAILKQIETDTPVYDSWTNKMYAELKDINSLSGAAQTAAIMQAVKYITVDNANISNDLGNLYVKLRTEISNQEATVGARIPAQVSSSESLSIVIGIVALLLAAGITFVIIRSITRPLAKVADAADLVAEGRVDVELDVHGRDEISKVAESFRAVIAHLKTMSEVVGQFANGHLNVHVTPKSDGDVLGHAFVDLRDQMQEALGERSATRQLQSGMGELLGTLQHLEQGLSSMNEGDLTVSVDAALSPIAPDVEGQSVGFVADSYNAMIESAQSSLVGYNEMRETLRQKLGDHSSLEALTERLESLTGETLANLESAMRAMNDGDLTITVDSQTSAIAAAEGENIGHLAEVFNEMLENTQSAVSSYNDMRAKIASMLAEISLSSESLSAASTQMASTSEETGRAIEEIANAVGTVASGAEQQVREVDRCQAHHRRAGRGLADVGGDRG